MKLLIVLSLVIASAFAQSVCRNDFRAVKDCMRSAFDKHVDGVTNAQADAMADCIGREAKTCIRAKLGPFAALLGNKFNIDVEQIQSMMECAKETIEPYVDVMKECVEKRHPNLDVDELMEEFKAKAENSRDDPKKKVIIMSILIIKMNEKLNCDALPRCARRAGVDLDALKKDVCEAKERCHGRNLISAKCKAEAKAIKESACECFDEAHDQMKADGVDMQEEMLECAKEAGMQLPNIPKGLRRRMGGKDGGAGKIKEKVCGEGAMDGSMGMCNAASKDNGNNGRRGGQRRRGGFFG